MRWCSLVLCLPESAFSEWVFHDAIGLLEKKEKKKKKTIDALSSWMPFSGQMWRCILKRE